jgi:uncharacterized protein involved in outer membrane biogenesis
VKFSASTFLRSRRGVAAVVVLLLIMFLFRPVVGELRSRIANSIGRALGRTVVLDNVRLRLLPRPGFDLEGLVIFDDPSFSAEPMIRAQEVSAAIRVRSLFRGRIEIATLSATEPSINLVRNNEGRWNLASLLQRNAQIPAAPTQKPAFERRPAFPYLEASNARVNFKIGQTKKSYALTNADVALWQDSENSWSARIKAEPVRTDFNLTDTGLLQVNATWQRASSLWLTPMEISVQWQKGQLGQITELLSGKDRGWRGGVDLTAKLSGTPEALKVESQIAIEDFRRYDIVGSESVRLTTGCSGRYDVATGTLSGLSCESPVNSGALRLRGSVNLSEAAQSHEQSATDSPAYDLTFEAEKVPLSSVVRLLRQAKKQVPSDLDANGLLNAEFHVKRDASRTAHRGVLERWTGGGSISDVRLLSQLSPRRPSNTGDPGKDEFDLGTIPLTLVANDALEVSLGNVPGHPKTEERENKLDGIQTRVRIGPVALGVNGSPPVNAGGWMSSTGYRFFLRGDMEMKDLFLVENLLGLPVARPTAEGSAKLDMSMSGLWQGFAPSVTAGTAQLRSVHAELRGLNAPIEIAAAAMSIAPDTIRMTKISARIGSTRWNGEVTAPRHCTIANAAPSTSSGVTPNCVFQFDLTADQLSTGEIADWFTAHSVKRPWYRILNSASDYPRGGSPLLAIEARGNLRVERFELGKLVAHQVATQMDVDRGKITLTDLRAQLLQGTHRGNWTIDLSNHDVPNRGALSSVTAFGSVPQGLRCHGSGTLHDILLKNVSTLMNDVWITGTADGTFELDGSGDKFSEALERSNAKLHFLMRNGSLTHIEIPGTTAPLQIDRFIGDLRLNKGDWEFSAGKVESRDKIYEVKGTASSNGGLEFVLTRGNNQSWTITGTLAKPHVAAVDRDEGGHARADAKGVEPN